MSKTTYEIGQVAPGGEVTHLAKSPERAKCGTKLDPATHQTTKSVPNCETCRRYAGIELKWICGAINEEDKCDVVYNSPIEVDEVWHKCPRKGKINDPVRRKMVMA